MITAYRKCKGGCGKMLSYGNYCNKCAEKEAKQISEDLKCLKDI